jgi:hypothetical protein
MGPALARLPYALLRDFLGFGLAAVHDDLRAQAVATTIAEEAPLLVPCFALLVWLCLRGARRLDARRLLLGLLVLPFVVLLPLSFVHERYLAFQVPFLLLCVAVGARGRPWALAACLAVHAVALAAYVAAPARVLGYPLRYGKEDWRAAAAFVDARRPAQVICEPPYLHLALDRYRGPSPAPPVEGRVIVVRSHVELPPPPGAIESLHLPAHTGIWVYVLGR